MFFNVLPYCSQIVFVSFWLSCLNLTPAASLNPDLQVLSSETLYHVPHVSEFWYYRYWSKVQLKCHYCMFYTCWTVLVLYNPKHWHFVDIFHVSHVSWSVNISSFQGHNNFMFPSIQQLIKSCFFWPVFLADRWTDATWEDSLHNLPLSLALSSASDWKYETQWLRSVRKQLRQPIRVQHIWRNLSAGSAGSTMGDIREEEQNVRLKMAERFS